MIYMDGGHGHYFYGSSQRMRAKAVAV